MTKSYHCTQIISYFLTLLNFGISVWFILTLNSLFQNTESDSYLQYDYLSGVLIRPYFILQIVTLSFDIGYFILYLLLVFIFCKTGGNEYDDNVLTKSIRENKMSNLFMEFLFTITVKGIALGFGFFYIIEVIIEAKRIIDDKSNEQSDKQNEILNQLLLQSKILFGSLLFQMIYILICYISRFISGCCCEDNEHNKRNKMNDKKLLSEESLLNEHSK